MAHERLPVLAHDHAMIGLLDDDPAVGLGALVPLGAQILDIGEGRSPGLRRSTGLPRLPGLHRLPRPGLDALEGHGRLLASGSGLLLSHPRNNALLARLLLLLLRGLDLVGHDALLVLHRPRTRGLGLHWLLDHRLLRVLRPLLGDHALSLSRFRLLLLLLLLLLLHRLHGLARLPGLLRLRLHRLRLLARLPGLLRLRLRRLRLLARLLLLLLLWWGSLLDGGLRALGARMLGVLAALGRRILGDHDGSGRRCGRNAFGGQEPLRQRQRGNCRHRQQDAPAGRRHSSNFLENLGQDPLLALRRPFAGRTR
jgi:hypothetical protein